MDNEGDYLGGNGADLLAKTARSAAGLIPFAGPLIGELISSIIPEQRIDRLVLYVRALEARLARIEGDKIMDTLKSSPAVSLAEDGFRAAALSASPARTVQIAELVANGIAADEVAANRQRHLLRILEELNEEEVIWLMSFSRDIEQTDPGFRERNAEVLAPARANLGADADTLDLEALQESYRAHLERLGLISAEVEVDPKTGTPVIQGNGQLKKRYRGTTHLGRMLLAQIGHQETWPTLF